MGLTTGLAVVWLIEPYVGATAYTRLMLLGGSLVVIGALFRLEVLRQTAAERTAKRYIELLCRLDHHDLSDAQVLDSLPKLEDGNPWGPVFARVRDRLVEYGQQADESEHSHSAAEVRLRRLENEQRQLREILDRLADPVFTINHYDELEWMNQAAQNWLSDIPASPADRKVDRLLPHKPLADLLIECRRRRNTHSQRSMEFECLSPTGEKQWFRAACRSLAEASGDDSGSHGALAILTDVTSERGIRQRHAEFVNSAAHELKTPLAAILAYVELLHDEEDSDEDTREEFLGVITTQAQRLQRLIENLLNLARIEAGVVKVDKRPVPLNEVLDQALSVVQPTAEQHGLEVVRDLSPMHLGVFVDRDMLLQATINLLSNAAKYTPPPGRISLRSRLDDDAVIFEVEDSGVGLSPEDCQKVFERFYRVKKNQDMAPGTGLGLPLVKHIVQDVHGGSITVISQLGKGSIFRVVLPAVSRGKS